MRHYPREQSWWQRVLRWSGPTCAACGLRWICDDGIRERYLALKERERAIKDREQRRRQSLGNSSVGTWSPVRGWSTRPYVLVSPTARMTPAQFRRSRGG